SKMKARKLHIVPVSIYNKRSLIKVGLALGKLKRQFEKREAIKKKDIKRELEKEFKDKF
ncbi:SsrA-binding protein, partial [Candidatus Woesebacteria bacterium]|nr:SsrA-binding protein [Candidatus Woesebacteria bacterium]